MKLSLEEKIAQLRRLSKEISEHRNEILKLSTSKFIRSFVDLTVAVEQIDCTREMMRGRADHLLSRPEETERKLRKEHLKLVHSKK
jgi:acyl-CoA reductase-like NAD-dependent aldehyde dehydrogenase